MVRNRYTNVQPWDNARVKLRTPIGGSDYVNASPISLRSLTPSSRHRGRRKASQETGNSVAQQVDLQENRYIATQGPKEGQFSHFWHMAFQESIGDVGVVVMLTQCYEGLKEKCAEYFPMYMDAPVLELPPEPKNEEGSQDSDGDPFLDSESDSADTDSVGTGRTTSQSGDNADIINSPPPKSPELTEHGKVELLSMRYDASLGSEVRELQVTIGLTTKKFYHYFYGKWADYGRVEPEDRVALLQLTRETRQVAGQSPRIVHCSAGVGRTGTWIALDFLLRELEEGRLLDQSYLENQTSTTQTQSPPATNSAGSGITKPDPQPAERKDTWGRSGPPKTTTPEPKESDLIHDTVDLLRQQRMMMVMNDVQYASLYEVLREQFIDKYAEKEVGVTVSTTALSAVGGWEGPRPKVRRMSTQDSVTAGVGGMGVDDGSQPDMAGGEEDAISEAETEIQGRELTASPTGVGGPGDGTADDGDDPYAAVSPDEVMREMEMDGGHEPGKEKDTESENTGENGQGK